MADDPESEQVEGLIEDVMGHLDLLFFASAAFLEDLREQFELKEFDWEAQYEMLLDFAVWARWALEGIEAHNNAILAISARLSDNPADFEERLRIMGFVTTYLQTYMAFCSLRMAASRGYLLVDKSDVDEGHLAHVLRRMCDVNRVLVLEMRNRGRVDANTPAQQEIQEAWFTRPDSAHDSDEQPCAWPAGPWQDEQLGLEKEALSQWEWSSRRQRLECELVPIPNPAEEPLAEDEEAIDVAGIVCGPRIQPRMPGVTYCVSVRVKFGEGARSMGYIRRTWYTGDLS